jgi:hypothetical protein
MAHTKLGSVGVAAVLVLGAVACASSPAAPFNQMESSNLTAFRLQNWEPAPTATPQGAAATQPGAALGLPPQIQQWIQQGAQGLQQLIPPGLLPPGLIPGGQGGAAAPTPTPQPENVPRFHNFRILGQTQVIDREIKETLADLLGDEDNFEGAGGGCMYAEMGLAFSTQPNMSNDVLISFSCNQVDGATFPWPHPSRAMKPKTLQKLVEIVPQIFPPMPMG